MGDALLGVNECDNSHVDAFLFYADFSWFHAFLVGSVLFEKKNGKLLYI